MERKVALITGANTGIGLALAQRLLQNDPSVRLCLACRNQSKAEAAQRSLMIGQPEAEVSILLVDVSTIQSVYSAAQQIKNRYKRIDYLYFNAGIMPQPSISWVAFWKGLFSSRVVHMFATGEGLLVQQDSLTPEGLRSTFATNVFGHFVLMRELVDVLGGTDHTSQVIWTSSSNASKEAFSLSNIQHDNGLQSYASSKYATDLLSVAINSMYNKQGIYSHTVCPGLVMTNLTYGILPAWIWTFVIPFLWLLRLFVPSVTVSPANSAEALVWLSKQKPESMDPVAKYHSCTSVMGRRYTNTSKMSVTLEEAMPVYEKLCEMERDIGSKYKISLDK